MDQAAGPMGYRLAKAALSRPLHRAYDIEVEGAELVPVGPVILAANHRSFMDSMFLALVMDRPVSFLAKAEYFDSWRTAWFFRSTGQIPLRRGSPAGARQAIDAGLAVLACGGTLGVYPEGTRSRDGRLHRGHLGPARLSIASGAPIVPIGLIGTAQVQHPGQRLPRMGKRISVRFGLPQWAGVDDRVDGANRAGQLRELTDRVMEKIAGLCGQPYVERFAEVARS